MFLLVSVRHVGAYPGEHQHGVSIQISYTRYSSDLNLGEGLCICTSFHFPDSGLYLLKGFDFDFDLFWMAWHWKPGKRSRFSKYQMTGSPVFSVNFTNWKNPAKPNYHLSMKKKQAILKCFIAVGSRWAQKTKPRFVTLSNFLRSTAGQGQPLKTLNDRQSYILSKNQRLYLRSLNHFRIAWLFLIDLW